MSHRVKSAEFIALIVAWNESYVDTRVPYIAAVQAESCICFGSAFCPVPSVACRLRTVGSDAVQDLNGTSSMDMTTKQDFA